MRPGLIELIIPWAATSSSQNVFLNFDYHGGTKLTSCKDFLFSIKDLLPSVLFRKHPSRTPILKTILIPTRLRTLQLDQSWSRWLSSLSLGAIRACSWNIPSSLIKFHIMCCYQLYLHHMKMKIFQSFNHFLKIFLFFFMRFNKQILLKFLSMMY